MIDLLVRHYIWWFIIPIIITYILSLISQQITRWAMQQTSYAIIAIIGFFGIVIHELSHLIIAILFHHNITDFKLWQISNDGVLGYVNHTYNKNSFYQRFGNVFIGLAPIFGLGLAVYSLTFFMYPPLLSWRLLVVICLMISFVFGFNLSRADWINFWYGVPFYLIIIFIVTIIQMLLKKD